VILLTDFPVVRLAVETPDGKVIDPGNAAGFGTSFDTGPNVRTARFNLPVAFQAHKVQAGTWYALLDVDRELLKKVLGDDRANQPALIGLRSKGAKYCLSVHSFSNLRMSAGVSQSGFVPGSTLFLRAALTEYGVPVDHRAAVTADLEYPDGTHTSVKLAENGPGVFGAALVGTQAGIYRFRVVAEGGTFRGVAFTREQLVNAAVWPGGDRPDQPVGDGGSCDCSKLFGCLAGEKVFSREFQERLKKDGINLDEIRRCLKESTRANRLPM